MAHNQHTPGPWAFDPDDFTEVFNPDSGAMICKVLEADDFPCLEEGTHGDVQDECLANARLIAAAPDMLEALKAAKETIRVWHGPNAWDIYDRSSPEMKAINEAIAKAEGRS